MKRQTWMLVLVSLLASMGCSRETNPEAEKAAIQAANEWLKLVDSGEYGESWDKAAEYFRNSVQKDAWEQQIKGAREPLAAVKSRELDSQQYMTSVPGAPDGEYVVLQFVTSFQNKEAAVETITPMLDKDGIWRVSGYFVK